MLVLSPVLRAPTSSRHHQRRAGAITRLSVLAVALAACVDLSPPDVSSRDAGRDVPRDMLGPAPDTAPDQPIAPDAEPHGGDGGDDGEVGAPDADPPDAPDDTPVPMDGPPDQPAPPDVGPPDVGPPDTAPPPDTPPPLSPNGTSCSAPESCASGKCVDGVCCATACTEACYACNRPASPGTCAPEANQTICSAATCSGGVATAAGRCDGAGTCVAGATTTCAPYVCYSTFCGSACLSGGDCAAPFTCSNFACVSPGLLLRWSFDEESGSTFQDASGNNRTGSGVGVGVSRPQPSSNAPVLTYANPRSRSFVASDDHGVVTGPIPSGIKSSFELTAAAWYRASDVVFSGSAVVALGSDYFLRLQAGKVEWKKRKSTTAGTIYAGCDFLTTTHLDGRWHHVAATAGAAGMKLYYDGREICASSNNEPPIFNGPDQFGAGQQPGNAAHNFNGEIDEVRLYGRVLTADEIAHLAGGGR